MDFLTLSCSTTNSNRQMYLISNVIFTISTSWCVVMIYSFTIYIKMLIFLHYIPVHTHNCQSKAIEKKLSSQETCNKAAAVQKPTVRLDGGLQTSTSMSPSLLTCWPCAECGNRSGCFLRWCCNNFALLAYCLWHQGHPCGWVVMLPTVWEKVGFGTPGISGTPP
jgi:hypothetical protein